MKPMITILILCIAFIFPGVAQSDDALHRGIFVTVLDKTLVLSSRESIAELIAVAQQARIKTLFIQIYRANKTWFPSKVGDQSPYEQAFKNVGEDPFALLIKQAHEAGLEVHAWLNLLSLSKNEQAPILKKYGPSILTKNLTPKKALRDYQIDNQYFLEPGDLRVRKELSLLVKEILQQYPTLDGIQYDYIRYPDVNPHYGYTSINMSRFKKATKQSTIVETSPIWHQWKRDQVTALLSELVREARRIRPNIQVSATGCLSYIRAMDEAFQDWPLWSNSGLVDFVTIMNYPEDPLEYKKHITEAKAHVKDFTRINIAVGAYKFMKTPAVFNEHLKACELSNGRACVIFHYGNLVENPQLKQYLFNND